jgi:hypothetical protein
VKVAVVLLIVFGVLGLAVTGAVLYFTNRVVDEFETSFGVANSADYDIADVECGVDSLGDVQAEGRITNTSAERRAFTIRVRFTDADGSLLTVDEGYTAALDPGQSTDWVVITFTEPTGRPSCEVDEVRYNSFGS